ncbi:hypothetical protein, partial [Nonomuraea dietziae]|uniref:hypothetical protein n=1 Tax=Nonomuraea dietziae TaxID=65515 RepID=UPI0031CECE8B
KANQRLPWRSRGSTGAGRWSSRGAGDPRRLVKIALEFGRLLHHAGESEESAARPSTGLSPSVRELDDTSCGQ